MIRRLIVPLATLFGLLATSGSACSVHDQFCQFHGIGRAVSNTIQQNSPTSVVIGTISDPATNSAIDFDNNVLLPDGNGPYIVSTTGFPARADQPYISVGDEQPRHVYPSQYQIDFQNGTAQATHSGDFNGGEIVPNAPGCTVSPAQYCEEVRILGNIPDPGTPEGFVVRQTNHLYNFQDVANPYIDVISYGAATGQAYFKQQSHLGFDITSDDPDNATQYSGLRQEFLGGQGAQGAEQVYYIGYDNFRPHAAGTVVHNAQRERIGSQEHRTQFGHETVAGDIDPYTGRYRVDTYRVYDVTYDHETYVDAETGLPALVRSEQETSRYNVTSGIYGVQDNPEYLDHVAALERERISAINQQQVADYARGCLNSDCSNLPTNYTWALDSQSDVAEANPYEGLSLGQIQYTQDCINGSSFGKCNQARLALLGESTREALTDLFVENPEQWANAPPAVLSGLSRVPTDTAGLVVGVTGVLAEGIAFDITQHAKYAVGLTNEIQPFDISESWNRNTENFFAASDTIQGAVDREIITTVETLSFGYATYNPDSPVSTVFNVVGESLPIGTGLATNGGKAVVRYSDDVTGLIDDTASSVDNLINPSTIPNGGTYTLRDPLTDQIMRNGRTISHTQREAQHAATYPNLTYRPETFTDIYEIQRGVEQIQLNTNWGAFDKINGISPTNPRRQEYLDAGQQFINSLNQ